MSHTTAFDEKLFGSHLEREAKYSVLAEVLKQGKVNL